MVKFSAILGTVKGSIGTLKMTLTDYLKEDKITLPEIAGLKRRLIPEDMIKKFEVMKELDRAAEKQKALGLGIPRADLSPEVEKLRKEIYEYNRSRMMKAGFSMVAEPPVEYFPRFSNGKITSIKGNKPPLLAMAKLEPGLARITCSVNGKNFKAPIPRFPAKAIEEVKKVKALAPNAEFSLLFMPSWGAVPQRDPMIVAKVQGKYFRVYAWDNDLDAIEKALGITKTKK